MAIYEKQVFTGSYGFDLPLEMKKDLSDVDSLRLRIITPLGRKIDRNVPVSCVQEPKDSGVVNYRVVLGDFSIPGLYKLQLFDETLGRKQGGEILQIRVRKSLDYKGLEETK